jgi:tetratricopeptide (TPR) repeat protein
VGRLLLLPGIPAEYRLLAAQRLAQFAQASGGTWFLTGLLSELRLGSNSFRALAFDTYLSIGDLDGARAAAAEPGDEVWHSESNQADLASAALLASGNAAAAVDLLRPKASPSPSPVVSRLLAALRATGRPETVLSILETHGDEFSQAESATARFDAHWELGNAEHAREAVESLAGGDLANFEFATRLRSAYVATGSTAEHAYERVLQLAYSQPRRSDVDWRIGLDFAYNHVDEILSNTASPEFADRLGPRGRYTLAAALYCQRDFDASRRQLRTLLGTTNHWDAEKLHARMLLEEGHFGAALDNRIPRSRLRPALDEVEYFARLHLGQYRHAFRMYLARHDANRLRATFGDSADFLSVDEVGSRFVIAQDGPGDELSMAATYSQLLAVSRRVTAACDPRLASLLRRSFPEVDFVPTLRQSSRPALGFLADDRPPRATGNMYDLLSAEAATHAGSADRVVLGRSLIRLTTDGAPYAPYLRPDPVLVEGLRFERPTVGVVWRSEFVDPMRSIHFVEPGALAALSALDVDVICLQHDATPAERAALIDALGGRVVFRDDLDLRDDFETMAAVTAACAAVVGVGTTTTELAAAVGTPTVYLHPNLIGAWRRGDDDRDHWHRTMRAAVTDDYRSPEHCVQRAVEILRSSVASAR